MAVAFIFGTDVAAQLCEVDNGPELQVTNLVGRPEQLQSKIIKDKSTGKIKQ